MKHTPLLILAAGLLLVSCGGNKPASSSQPASQDATSEATSIPQTTSEVSIETSEIVEESSEVIEQTSIVNEESSDEIELSSDEETSEAPYVLDLKVVAPTGAPAVGLYRHLGESEEMLDINADPDNVVAFLNQGSAKDIVICPTNAGIKAIQNGAPFKLAATITFGNFYLAGTGHDENRQLDSGDYVVLFQQGKVPDRIFKYAYADKNLTNIHYVNSAADAAACMVSGINTADDNAAVDYVMVAEPSFTANLSKNPNAYQYESISEKYAQVSDNKPLMQASVFVNNSTDKNKADAFLASLEEDINDFIENPAVIDPYVESLGEATMKSKLGVPSTAILKRVTQAGNRMGLGYKDAYENKEAVSTFLTLFNMTADEEVYYK